MTLKGSIDNAKVRVLLMLWGVAGVDQALTKGKMKPLELSQERAGDYDAVFAALEADGAITVKRQKSGRISNVVLTPTGYELLGNWLRSPDFGFEGTQVSAKLGNYLLKWIAHTGAAVAESAPKISSYDEFKVVVIEVFDRLNRGYNFNDFVPIYRIRQEFGERVDRLDFNDWMLKMQEEKIFHLRTGGLEVTETQKQDSINDEYRDLLFFATQS